MTTRLNVTKWKGKDELLVEEFDNEYVLVEHRQNKETGKVKEIETVVPKEHVYALLTILRNNCVQGESYGYKYVVRKLTEYHGWHKELGVPIDLFIDMFNGGSNRARFYFPYYYFPMKVLELTNTVTYLGRGGVILKDE